MNVRIFSFLPEINDRAYLLTGLFVVYREILTVSPPFLGTDLEACSLLQNLGRSTVFYDTALASS